MEAKKEIPILSVSIKYLPKGKRTKHSYWGANGICAMEVLQRAYKTLPVGSKIVKATIRVGSRLADSEIVMVPVFGYGYTFKSLNDFMSAAISGVIPGDFPDDLMMI